MLRNVRSGWRGARVWLLIPAITVMLTTCQWFVPDDVTEDAGGPTTEDRDDPTTEVVTGSEFIIAWDKSATVPSELSIVGYEVFHRVRGVDAWQSLGTTENEETEFLVANGDLAYGEYEFGVEEIYSDGSRSERHASTDTNAIPSSGWYVDWQGP